MGRHVNEAIRVAMERVELEEQRLVAFQESISGLEQEVRFKHNSYEMKAMDEATSYLHLLLYSRIREAYRALMVAANLGTSDQQKNVRRQVAIKRFRRGVEVMSMLDISGLPPGRYHGTRKEEFEAEIMEAVSAGNDDAIWSGQHSHPERLREEARLRIELYNSAKENKG